MRQRQRHLTERVMRSQINMKDSILILAGGMRLTFIMCHSLSCYNQLPQTGWLNDLFLYIEQNKINKTLQFWRLGSSRARCWQVQCLLRVCSLVCKLPSSCNPHWWRAERGRASSPVCYEGTNAIHEGLTPMTKYLSRHQLPATVPWMDFCGSIILFVQKSVYRYQTGNFLQARPHLIHLIFPKTWHEKHKINIFE